MQGHDLESHIIDSYVYMGTYTCSCDGSAVVLAFAACLFRLAANCVNIELIQLQMFGINSRE